MCVTLIKSSTQVRRIPVSIVICFEDMQINLNVLLQASIEPKSFPRPKVLYLVDLYFFILSSTPCFGGGTHPVTQVNRSRHAPPTSGNKRPTLLRHE